MAATSEDEIRRLTSRAELRRGAFQGVWGTSLGLGGYYLSPDQFGYTTAQAGSAVEGGGLGDGGAGGGGDGGGGGGAA